MRKGKCKITAVAAEGQGKAVCNVTVGTPVKSIKLVKKTFTLKRGKSANIKVSFMPRNASVKKVSYLSSNAKVASVSAKGKVRAVKAGKCTIAVTSKDGRKKAYCKVVVK